jgi:transcriptional regulator with XRE-family HTH domain
MSIVSALVGSRLRDVREARGLTRRDLARALPMFGVRWDERTIGKVERGERVVTVDELAGLATLLDLPLADLF